MGSRINHFFFPGMVPFDEHGSSAFSLCPCSLSPGYALNIMLSGICAMRVKSAPHRLLHGGCRALLQYYGPEPSDTEPWLWVTSSILVYFLPAQFLSRHWLFRGGFKAVTPTADTYFF